MPDRPARLKPYPSGPMVYEWFTWPVDRFRRLAVDLLAPQPGEVVIDVACGTGRCFGLLEQKVGPRGRIIAVDQCPDMLGWARSRAESSGWDNVTLVASAVEDLDLPGDEAGAALFCATHDVLRSPDALAAVFRHLRPGSRVVAVGPKLGPPWMLGPNLAIMVASAPYVSTFDGWARPWSHLEHFLDDMSVEEVGFGTGYLLLGRARPGRSRH